MSDKNVDSAVNDLLEQLQEKGTTASKDIAKQELSKEDMEKFLLQYSSQLIKGSVEFVEDLKQYITSAPSAEDVTAMASLVISSAAAIETLNRLLITNKNNDIKVQIKQMDIESKKQLQQLDMQGKLLMNREELLKQLLNEAKIVDVVVSEKL